MDIKFMPLLFVNFAGEMIYILNQRLQAQNFVVNKSRKILTDLVQAMFEKRFIEELFKLQNIYARHSLKVFFEKFAHCSIMRLTDNSMDKLYDLMTMTVKYQIETCITPNHILSISLNHIDGIRKILPDDQDSLSLLQSAHNKLLEIYGGVTVMEKALIRGALLSFFQETRVRISSFLREKKQLSNGHYVLFPTRWIEIATDVEVPGRIRNYFYDGKGERSICEGKFSTGTKDYTYIKNIAEIDLNWDGEERGTELGENIFQAPETVDVYKSKRVTRADTLEMQEEGDELKFLTKLISQGSDAENKDIKLSFDLDIFNEEDEPEYSAENGADITEHSNETRIDAAQSSKDLSVEIAKLKLEDGDDIPKRAPKGVDMLNLLDEAVEKGDQMGRRKNPLRADDYKSKTT